jgi:hypothetical protein
MAGLGAGDQDSAGINLTSAPIVPLIPIELRTLKRLGIGYLLTTPAKCGEFSARLSVTLCPDSRSACSGNIASPLRAVLKRQKNASVVLGEVTDIDVENRRIILNEKTIAYEC